MRKQRRSIKGILFPYLVRNNSKRPGGIQPLTLFNNRVITREYVRK